MTNVNTPYNYIKFYSLFINDNIQRQYKYFNFIGEIFKNLPITNYLILLNVIL